MSNDKEVKHATSKNVEIKLDILNSEEFQSELRTLKEVFTACYGPTARTSLIQHVSGGHVTVTSSSHKILKNVTAVSTPLTRLLLQSVQGHVNQFNDGGLFTALLAIQFTQERDNFENRIRDTYHINVLFEKRRRSYHLPTSKLIESSLKCGIPRHTAIAVNELALATILKRLESSDPSIKLEADLGDMKQMLCVIRSILATKPAAGLTDKEMQSLAVSLLRGFLGCIPTSGNERVSLDNLRIQDCEGPSVSESCLKTGILLESKCYAVNDETISGHQNDIKVALFDCSLAGNVEDRWLENAKTEIASDTLIIEDNVLTSMMRMVDGLIEHGVKLVACQKVIHPTLQRYITGRGLYVIERLSICHIEAVRKLTGAKLLSTFQGKMNKDNFGSLAEIKLSVIHKKRYIHLIPHPPTHPQISTLLLCAPDEHALDELRLLCGSVLHALKHLLYQPSLVPGGGCFETIIAALLMQTAQEFDGVQEMECSKQQYSKGLHSVASVFLNIARKLDHDGSNHLVDRTTCHHWISRSLGTDLATPRHCECGQEASRPETEWYMLEELCGTLRDVGVQRSSTVDVRDFENAVLDVMSMKVSGIKMAFETANMILRVKHFVKEIFE